MGASFALRMHEDTGATAAEVARAFTIAREIFRARDFWQKVEALDNRVESKVQIGAMLEMWNLLRQVTRWVLNQAGDKLDIRASIERLAPGLGILEKKIRKSPNATEEAQVAERSGPLEEGGMPKSLANWAASLHLLYPALDVVETAAKREADVRDVARVFYGLGESLGLNWLRGSVEKLSVEGQWHALARGNLRDELYSHHRKLVGRVLEAYPEDKNPLRRWLNDNAREVENISIMLKDMHSLGSMDYAVVSVAVRSLDRLVVATESS